MTQPMFRHRNLPQLLLQTRETVLAGFRPILRQFGVTEQQWRVIRALDEHGPMAPNQISEACLILGPSLTRMLAGMEDAGLIRRERSATDQRRQLVTMTDRCHALVAEMEPLVIARYRELEQLVGSETLQGVYRALDAMLASFGSQPRSPEASDDGT